MNYMTPPKTILRLSLIAVLASGWACSSNDSTSPQPSLDVNSVIAQTAKGDLSTFAGARSAIGLPGVTLPNFDPASCPFLASDQSFTCAPRTEGSITYNLKYFLYDQNGQPLATVNPATTSSVRTVVDIVGAVSGANGSGSGAVVINHHSDMMLVGLLSATKSLSGTTRDRDTVVTTNGSTTIHTAINATSTTSNVVLPANTTNPYPASGSITTDITGSSTLGSVFSTNTTAHGVLTFNGTKLATLIFTIDGTTKTCQIDLSGGSVPKC
jgi:hypothetical protein